MPKSSLDQSLGMLSPKAKRNILRIIPFGLIWLLSGLVFLVVERAAMGEGVVGVIDIDLEVFIFSQIAITTVGLLVGAIELFYLNKVFAKKSLTRKILYKTGIYLGLLVVVTVTTYPIAASLELDTNILDRRVWEKLWAYLTSVTHLSTDLQLAVALGASLFYYEISENIGPGILVNFFTGKYHSPTEEVRIFMFSDMKSSTSIAEKLGHIRYFELLREYYFDLSDAIIQYSGEIYQYVGDEIIVSWKFQEGIRDNNCIRTFYAMKEDLSKRAEWYQVEFGIVPSFKAGFHFGKVTTGEIGALKKEIIFTGDVLNSTARIQQLCNEYKVQLLLSGDLVKNLDLEPEFKVKPLGNTRLRGKTEDMELFTIE